jgi:chromosomal replication initiator protein
LESAHDIWQKALGELQTQVSRANYNTWLRNSHGVSYDDGVLVVGAPSAFVAEWLTRRLCSLVKKTLSHVTGSETEVQFIVQDRTRAARRPQLQSALADGCMAAPPRVEHNGSRFTFENFVVGACNRLAYATALETAENPLSAFNPLFIYGGTGQGKSHLLQAIAHSARERNREVMYTTAERFTDEFVMAVKQKRVEEFHAKFSGLSLFLFDDIQFLANKRQTQQCFYHIFDELLQKSCQIAIVGDHSPRDIQLLGDKLRSRLESGMVACIQPPDLDSRVAFLQTKAEESDVTIPPDALRLIAEEVRGNVRQLEGAIVYLSAQARVTGEPVTAQTVHRLLTSVATSSEGRSILHAVGESFNVPVEDLLGKKRDRKTSLARHAAMYLMRTQTNCSFAEIGKELGGRNHATVLHGCHKMQEELPTNPRLERQLAKIVEQLPSARNL